MRPDGRIKLVSELLDLPLLDKDNRWCGIVDDIEFDGGAGEDMRVKAILVGPGTYKGRMPAWLFTLFRLVGGDRISRVPYREVDGISSAAHLKCPAEKVGLHVVEDKVRTWIPHKGAM